jgi:hypothetical protein
MTLTITKSRPFSRSAPPSRDRRQVGDGRDQRRLVPAISRAEAANIARWLENDEQQFRAGVPLSEDDRQWFAWQPQRAYRVRPTRAADLWIFQFGHAEPTGHLTIIRRDWWRAIVARDIAGFGPVTDSDAYAMMRIEALERAAEQ